MISHREAETLRALERQAKPSTGAEIGRQLHEMGVIDNYARAHQLLDALRNREMAQSSSGRPQRWTLTAKGRETLAAEPSSLRSVLAEFGVRIIHRNAKRRPRDTQAEGTILGLWNNGKGEAHLRDVLTCLTQTENNAFALTGDIINVTSRLLLAHSDWWESDASRWLEVYDQVNLLELERLAKGNKAVSAPAALTQELYRRLLVVFGPFEKTLFGD